MPSHRVWIQSKQIPFERLHSGKSIFQSSENQDQTYGTEYNKKRNSGKWIECSDRDWKSE